MKVISLKGKEDIWYPKSRPRANHSKHHKRVLSFLQGQFPTCMICEECPFKPSDKVLYFDFFIPIHNIAVEADGGQHDKYNKFFYKNMMEFVNAKKNDRQKEEWCELNGISLFRFSEKEKDEQWINRIFLKETRN